MDTYKTDQSHNMIETIVANRKSQCTQVFIIAMSHICSAGTSHVQSFIQAIAFSEAAWAELNSCTGNPCAELKILHMKYGFNSAFASRY